MIHLVFNGPKTQVSLEYLEIIEFYPLTQTASNGSNYFRLDNTLSVSRAEMQIAIYILEKCRFDPLTHLLETKCVSGSNLNFHENPEISIISIR